MPLNNALNIPPTPEINNPKPKLSSLDSLTNIPMIAQKLATAVDATKVIKRFFHVLFFNFYFFLFVIILCVRQKPETKQKKINNFNFISTKWVISRNKTN